VDEEIASPALRDASYEPGSDRHAPSGECGGGFDVRLIVSLMQRAEEIAFHHGDGDAVAVGDSRSGDGADTVGAGEDADQVERIAGADDGEASVCRRPADLAKLLHGFGQRELFAGHAGDE